MQDEEIPRRFRLDQQVPAELAIRDAMLRIEEMPADPLLTEAVVLLEQARSKVADWVDRDRAPSAPPFLGELVVFHAPDGSPRAAIVTRAEHGRVNLNVQLGGHDDLAQFPDGSGRTAVMRVDVRYGRGPGRWTRSGDA
jgi:hypothetical protein